MRAALLALMLAACSHEDADGDIPDARPVPDVLVSPIDGQYSALWTCLGNDCTGAACDPTRCNWFWEAYTDRVALSGVAQPMGSIGFWTNAGGGARNHQIAGLRVASWSDPDTDTYVPEFALEDRGGGELVAEVQAVVLGGHTSRHRLEIRRFAD